MHKRITLLVAAAVAVSCLLTAAVSPVVAEDDECGPREPICPEDSDRSGGFDASGEADAQSTDSVPTTSEYLGDGADRPAYSDEPARY